MATTPKTRSMLAYLLAVTSSPTLINTLTQHAGDFNQDAYNAMNQLTGCNLTPDQIQADDPRFELYQALSDVRDLLTGDDLWDPDCDWDDIRYVINNLP